MNDDIIIWGDDILKNVARSEAKDMSLEVYDILMEWIPRLFNTSPQGKDTEDNIKEFSQLIEAYYEKKVIYRVVRTIGIVEIGQGVEDDKGVMKNSPTTIIDIHKYKGNPKKLIENSKNIAEALKHNLYVMGDTQENKALRKLLEKFINNHESFTKEKGLRKGEVVDAIMPIIEEYFLDLKLKGKEAEVKKLIIYLKQKT